MNPILNIINAKSYHWGKNAAAFELCETGNLSVKLEILPSKETEQLHHHHHSTQVFYVINGIAKFIIDGSEIELRINECIIIYPNQIHLVRNENSEDLQLLVVSHPSTKNDRQNAAHI